MLDEGHHRALQFPFRYLPMPYQNARLRHEFLDLGGDLVDRLDAIVDEVGLPATFELMLDSRTDQCLVEWRDDGLHGDAIARRRLDGAHIAQTDQRHMQRARDWCRRHGEHVDFFFQLLEPLFVADAEALLFVYDDKAEVLPLDVLREETMCADEDVDLALL